MDENSFKQLVVPPQRTGKVIDTEKSIEFSTEEDAIDFFKLAKQRLINVNEWHEIAGELTASFMLHNADAEPVQRTIQKGDYFKIDITGPGSEDGEGYDWIQVEAYDEFDEPHFHGVAFTVRPVKNPQNPDAEDVTHFFSEESTSTFTVRREKNKIIAGVYDRNTQPNLGGSGILDKIRNAITGLLGVSVGAKAQWTLLTKAIVEDEDDKNEKK